MFHHHLEQWLLNINLKSNSSNLSWGNLTTPSKEFASSFFFSNRNCFTSIFRSVYVILKRLYNYSRCENKVINFKKKTKLKPFIVVCDVREALVWISFMMEEDD